MSSKSFISHNSIDKPFVRKLAKDLNNQNLFCWVDEGEMKAGDSLILKISEGLDESDYVIAVISNNSRKSNWVTKELSIAITKEVLGHNIKVIPIRIDNCEMPTFLIDKLYIDFSNNEKYTESFIFLLKSMDIIFNKKAYFSNGVESDLGTSINKAIMNGFPILHKPFHRPFQYIGLSLKDASESTKALPDSNNNLIYENNDCRMLLESEGNYISYVEIIYKNIIPFKMTSDFDPEIVFGSLSINPEELDFVSQSNLSKSYYDHSKKLQIIVCELYSNGPLSIGFGKKYYGLQK